MTDITSSFEHIVTYDISELRQYLDFIDGDLYNNDNHLEQDFVYRGCGSSKFDLKPSALRPKGIEFINNASFLNKRLRDINDWDNPYLKLVRELNIVANFYISANQQNIKIPALNTEIHEILINNDMMGTDKSLSKLIRDDCREWPPKSLVEIFSLAQHYSIPTRLLDWSYDPIVALYFASESALRNEESDVSDFCVWIMNKEIINKLSIFNNGILIDNGISLENHNLEFSIRLIDTQYHQNQNLSAQRGLFSITSMINNSFEYSIHDRCIDIDEAANISYNKLRHITGDSILGTKKNIFTKLIFKKKNAASIILQLARMNYRRASIFPGLGSIKEQIEILSMAQKFGK